MNRISKKLQCMYVPNHIRQLFCIKSLPWTLLMVSPFRFSWATSPRLPGGVQGALPLLQLQGICLHRNLWLLLETVLIAHRVDRDLTTQNDCRLISSSFLWSSWVVHEFMWKNHDKSPYVALCRRECRTILGNTLHDPPQPNRPHAVSAVAFMEPQCLKHILT